MVFTHPALIYIKCLLQTFLHVLNCAYLISVDAYYLLCETPDQQRVDVTASSQFNVYHYPGRSCLNSQNDGDGRRGKGDQ